MVEIILSHEKVLKVVRKKSVFLGAKVHFWVPAPSSSL